VIGKSQPCPPHRSDGAVCSRARSAEPPLSAWARCSRRAAVATALEKSSRAPQLDVAGFAYAELAGDPPPDLTETTTPDGTTVYVDPDGFAFSVRPTV